MKKSLSYYWTIFLTIFLSSIFLINSEAIGKEPLTFKSEYFKEKGKLGIRKQSKSAFEVFTGSFYKGTYAPFSIRKNEYNSCNSFTFCNFKKNLSGKLIGARYIKRIASNKSNYFDIDTILLFGKQPLISSKNTLYSNDYKKTFTLISFIPTYRYYFPNESKNSNIGVGVGLNIALNPLPSERENTYPLNSQVNLEFAHNISKVENIDLVFNLQHRCTLFGLIGGKLQGRQWYTLGLRKWL